MMNRGNIRWRGQASNFSYLTPSTPLELREAIQRTPILIWKFEEVIFGVRKAYEPIRMKLTTKLSKFSEPKSGFGSLL